MDTETVLNWLSNISVGTIIAVVTAIGIIGAGIWKVISMIIHLHDSYTEIREERDQLKQKVEDHDRELEDIKGQFAGAIEGITQQLSEIKFALDEQRETKIKELRHQITVAAETALANGKMTVREWTSLHEMVDEYVNKYHQNWYVKPLIAKVDQDVHVIGRLDEHGNDIVE